MTTDKSTPRPWIAECPDPDAEYPDRGAAFIIAAGEGLVGAALPLPTELESGDFSRVKANASLIVTAVNERDAIRKALVDIGDDYMTSAQHHPGYVLIPVAKFDQLREAFAALRQEQLK